MQKISIAKKHQKNFVIDIFKFKIFLTLISLYLKHFDNSKKLKFYGNYISTPLYTATPLLPENLTNLYKNFYLRVFRFKTLKSGSKITKVVKILIIINLKF